MSKPESWSQIVSNLATPIIAVVSLIWAIKTFHHASYKPQVNISSSIKITSRTKDKVVLNIEFDLKNQSNARVQIVGSVFNLYLTKLKKNLNRDKAEYLRESMEKLNTCETCDRDAYSLISPPEIFTNGGFGKVLPDDFWFEPNESFKRDLSFVVPSNFDQAILKLVVHMVDKEKCPSQLKDKVKLEYKINESEDGPIFLQTFELYKEKEVFERYDPGNLDHIETKQHILDWCNLSSKRSRNEIILWK